MKRLLLLALAVTCACASALRERTPVEESAQNRQLVEDSIERVWGERRLDEIARFVSADFVDHGALPGTRPGPEGFADGVRHVLAAFPDAKNHIDDIFAVGDRVVVRWTMTGTHLGDGLGFPATHRPIQLSGITVARVLNGRIVEHWTFRDDISMLRQLGVVP